MCHNEERNEKYENIGSVVSKSLNHAKCFKKKLRNNYEILQ